MKHLTLLLLFIVFPVCSSGQFTEGQNFCNESIDAGYFPILNHDKYILWSDTYYTEVNNGPKEIKGKVYTEFIQKWKTGNSHKLYLREENGVVYQFEECCDEETVRYDEKFDKGHIWNTASGHAQYKILSFTGTLSTPFCEYENLLVIEADLKDGIFQFYYLKGHGYVGATIEGKTISCVTPTLKKQ